MSQAEAAEQFGVSVDSLQRAKTVLEHGSPELVAAVEKGDLAVSAAAQTVGARSPGPRPGRDRVGTTKPRASLRRLRRKKWIGDSFDRLYDDPAGFLADLTSIMQDDAALLHRIAEPRRREAAPKILEALDFATAAATFAYHRPPPTARQSTKRRLTGAIMADESNPRLGPISVTWTADRTIGRLYLGEELWAAVEWSEKRQAWCIEDAEGRCLTHTAHIRGTTASKTAAVALAKAMIRDGHLPSPQEARAARRARREKRRDQPAQRRKREARALAEQTESMLYSNAWRAEEREKVAPPLYEVLADVFDFTDPELWKSNTFAALRPRLVVHLQAAVARLDADLARHANRATQQPFAMFKTVEQRRAAAARRQQYEMSLCDDIRRRLDRARQILAALDPNAPIPQSGSC